MVEQWTLPVYIRSLHVEAGKPSLREVAAKSDVAHVTVGAVLNGSKLGKWSTVKTVVEALGGDVVLAERLWQEAAADQSKMTAGEPPILVAPFYRVMFEWVDSDVACFALGRALGLFPASGGFDAFQRYKHVFWASNVVGEALHAMLMELVRRGVAEYDGQFAFRWKDGVAPEVEVARG